MKAVGVVAEFNPFHRGHAYLLESIRKAFPDRAIVCVMSGNFVQRGAFAVQQKYSRARSALLCGADLVLEIPYPFSSLSSEGFAACAMHLLTAIPSVDTLAFGSEICDTFALRTCAENLSSPAYLDAFRARRQTKKGYPALQYEVYRELFGECEPLLSPNSSLAVQYLAYLHRENKPLGIYPVSRFSDADTLSASAIRASCLNGRSVDYALPAESAEELKHETCAGRFPVTMETLAPVLFYLLKTRSAESLGSYYGLAPLVHRAKKALFQSDTVEDLVKKTVSATYTASRVRRAFLSLLCGARRGAEQDLPAYTLLLGSTEKGRGVLGDVRGKTAVPVFSKPAHALRCADECVKRQAQRSFAADEIYETAFPSRQEQGFFFKQSPVYLA